MRFRKIVGLVLCSVLAVGHMQAQVAVLLPPPKPTIYITPTEDGFEVCIAAAMAKKEVPARIVDKVDNAAFVLKSAQVDTNEENRGIENRVQLIDSLGAVRWSYSVNKGWAAKNCQSTAEAVAKHLKTEFFQK